jgi:Isocitrate/isopropylmalate dehydrogenase
MSKTFKIAAIAGDGIGKEVLPEGLRVLEQAAKKWQLDLSIEVLDWAHCDYYLEHGQMMPDDWFEQLKGFDAIYFGAVGWPDKVPDHISLWGSLLKFRRDFDQYVNIRPVRLFPGVPCPLAGRKPGDIDFVVIRENTEGEYSSVGGKMFEGTEHEFVLQESVFTRRGVDRILKFAFRPGPDPTAQAPDGGDQVQRDFHQHAVLGRAHRIDGGAIPGHHLGQAAHRHSVRAFRAATGSVRCGGGVKPVR